MIVRTETRKRAHCAGEHKRLDSAVLTFEMSADLALGESTLARSIGSSFPGISSLVIYPRRERGGYGARILGTRRRGACIVLPGTRFYSGLEHANCSVYRCSLSERATGFFRFPSQCVRALFVVLDGDPVHLRITPIRRD